MLVIKAAQLAAFAAGNMRHFEARVMSHIARCFPDSMVRAGREKLIYLIRQGVTRGPTFGLQTERDIVLFIDLTLIFGEDFETAYPQAGQVLTDDSLSGSDKVEWLLAFFNDVPESSHS